MIRSSRTRTKGTEMLNEKIIETLTDDNGDPLKINADNIEAVELAISKAVALLRFASVLGFDVDIIKGI